MASSGTRFRARTPAAVLRRFQEHLGSSRSREAVVGSILRCIEEEISAVSAAVYLRGAAGWVRYARGGGAGGAEVVVPPAPVLAACTAGATHREVDASTGEVAHTMTVPVPGSDGSLGVVHLERQAGASPTPAEEQLIELLAAQLGFALQLEPDGSEGGRAASNLRERIRAQAEAVSRLEEELRLNQARLLVSEKMAALGKLTAGIAHEINSPLGGVLNSLELARGYADEYRRSATDPEVTPADHQSIAEDLIDTLDLAKAATQKVSQFVRSIKEQTRGSAADIDSSFDPAEQIESTVLLLGHELRTRQATVVTELEAGLSLSGDPGQFGLIIQNLVTNAADASRGEPLEIVIRCSRQRQRLRLEVQDDGAGIPAEIRPRIFDYLFTTKAVGKGTGLGLSTVHSIVSSHFGGSIDFTSEVGRGTTFSILLPLRAQRPDHGA